MLWLLAVVVGLLGAVSCVTIVLLPVGVTLLLLAGSLFRRSMALLLPREVSHPFGEAGKTARRGAKRRVKRGRKKVRRVSKRLGLSS